LKKGYDTAAEKGKEVAMKAGEKWDEAIIKGKMTAAFKLIAGLDASGVVVEVKGEKVYLSGTVPTELDKMKVEGAAFGVTGSLEKFESTVTVKPK
jgi:osmotically-inducible protein OsmY